MDEFREDWIDELIRHFGLEPDEAEEIVNNITALNTSVFTDTSLRVEGEFLTFREAYEYIIELSNRFGMPEYNVHIEFRLFRFRRTFEFEFFVVWTPSP